MRIARKRAPHALVLLTALATALSACGSSSAATPCWKSVLSDWSNHRLGQTTYAISCYDQAVTNLPPDIRYYSDAADAIQAAKLAAINKQQARHTAGFNGGSSSSSGGGTSSGGSDNTGGPTSPMVKVLGSSSADSVPVPLLIVAGLAILLLAAGAVGIANRHVQARRVTPDDPAA